MVSINNNKITSDQNKTITHPLERYKLIADPIIRQQAIDNFDEKHYNAHYDNGTIQDSIIEGFNWGKTPQGNAYWDEIYDRILEGTLELLPEPIEEPTVTELKNSMREPYLELDQLRSENEKLRECLSEGSRIVEDMITDIPKWVKTEREGNFIKQAKNLLNK